MKGELLAMGRLVGRSLRIFLRDKVGVFFSLLAQLIVLLLYVLFLGEVQMSSAEAALQGVPVEENVLRAFVDGWMLAGVMAVSCITVSFSAQNIMIADRERNVLSDILVSPVGRQTVTFAYFVSNVVVTAVICLVVLAVSFGYLAFSGWYLSAGDVFGILGLTLLSVLSAALISTLVCSFFKSTNAHGAFVGILSAAIGFLTGAYMPISVFPTAVQYLVLFIPGTYSAGAFRNLFMSGALSEIAASVPPAAEGLREGFSMNMDFFGATIGLGEMLWIFAGTVLLFLAIDLLVHFVRRSSKQRS